MRKFFQVKLLLVAFCNSYSSQKYIKNLPENSELLQNNWILLNKDDFKIKLRKLDDETATDSADQNNPDITITEDNSQDSENTDNKTPDENQEESDNTSPEDTTPADENSENQETTPTEEGGADNKENPQISPAPVVIPFTGTMTTCLECAADPTKKFCQNSEGQQDKWTGACCEPNDLSLQCTPSSTNLCSGKYSDSPLLYYSKCPSAQDPNICSNKDTLEFLPEKDSQTMTFQNLLVGAIEHSDISTFPTACLYTIGVDKYMYSSGKISLSFTQLENVNIFINAGNTLENATGQVIPQNKQVKLNKEYKIDIKQFLNYFFVVVPSGVEVSETKYEFKFSIEGDQNSASYQWQLKLQDSGRLSIVVLGIIAGIVAFMFILVLLCIHFYQQKKGENKHKKVDDQSQEEPIHKRRNLAQATDPIEIHEMTMINARSPHPDSEKHHQAFPIQISQKDFINGNHGFLPQIGRSPSKLSPSKINGNGHTELAEEPQENLNLVTPYVNEEGSYVFKYASSTKEGQALNILKKSLNEILELTPEAFYRSLDSTKINAVKVSAFESAVLNRFQLKLTKEQVKLVCKIMDEDCDGIISLQEYYQTLETFGVRCEGGNPFFKSHDPRQNISFHRQAMFKLLQFMKQHKISNEDLFKDIDENNDKSVTLAELENKLKSYDYFTKKEILAIHGYFDKNNDEVIDFKEFNSQLKQTQSLLDKVQGKDQIKW